MSLTSQAYFDFLGYAALHYCSIYGNLQGVEALLSARATVDLQDKKSGRTPLFHALDNSHSSISRALLKAGAMAHITNYAGQTPIPIVPVTERESSPCKILSVTWDTQHNCCFFFYSLLTTGTFVSNCFIIRDRNANHEYRINLWEKVLNSKISIIYLCIT